MNEDTIKALYIIAYLSVMIFMLLLAAS